MLKKTLIAIVVVAILAIMTQAHEPWPTQWVPDEYECTVVIHPVRYIVLEPDCKIVLEQEGLEMYYGNMELKVIHNCACVITADIQDNGLIPGTYEVGIYNPGAAPSTTPDDTGWGDPVSMTVNVPPIHPTTDPLLLGVGARLMTPGGVDISFIPFCEETEVATILLTVVPEGTP